MESKVRVLPPEELMDQLLGLLEDTESVPLLISGNSMSPFMIHGRDTVYLSKVKEPLKKGDMILYRRASGAYILHRICKVRSTAQQCVYDLVGDAQTLIEPGIKPEQVLAVVVAVNRKGKLLKKGSFLWEFFEKVWLRLIPLRHVLMKAYTLMTKWKR